MTTNVTYAYAADIVKAEKTPDGHLLVHGKAAGPELDLDGQICDPLWLKAAMPEWQRWGNVRAQHTAVAAGVGKELIADGDSWMLTAKVVDADSKTKVQEGVYKGYSIGVKNARVVRDAHAPKGRIVGGQIVEISLVDRPCNPTATLAICKSFGAGLAPVDAHGAPLASIDVDKGVLSPDMRKTALATVSGVLEGDLLKELSEGGNVEAAWDAIRQVADLIISEAEGLKSGDAHEIRDIEELLRAVRCLECFIDREEREDMHKDDYPNMDLDMAAYKAALLAEEDKMRADLTKQILADLEKGAPAIAEDDDAEDDEDDENDELGEEDDEKAYVTKAVGAATMNALLTKVAGLEAQLRTATEEAQAHAAKVEAMQAELKKVAGTPIPGGPRLVAPARAVFESTALNQVSDADRYRQLAKSPHVSPDLAMALEQAAREEVSAAS